jgi:nicotinamidase-related amidase
MDYLAPEFEASALVTIDVQVDFLEGEPLAVEGANAAVPGIVALADAYREAGRPIVHIVRLYDPDGGNVDVCRRAAVEAGAPYLLPGTRGARIVAGVAAEGEVELDHDALLAGEAQDLGEREIALYKPRWGAFYGTDLEERLRAAGVSTVVFCGWNFPNCPRTSAYEASERDFRVVLAGDATAGYYERGGEELEAIGIRVAGSAEIADALRARTA